MAKKINETNYVCLSASLRAKEAKLLTREQLERMLSEPSFSDACRAAADAGYADMSDLDVNGVNAALEARLAEELEELRQSVPDGALLRILCLQYDCHNAKVLVKAGGDAEAGGSLFSGAGCYSVEQLREVYLADNENGELTPAFAQAIRDAKVALARTGNPQLSDYILDRAYFAELLREAEATGRLYYVSYVRNRIDKVNLRSLLRTMEMGKRGELLKSALIEGGSIGLDQIADPALSREDVEKLYASTIFDRAAGAADMTGFEKAADNAELDAVAGSSLIAFGPEVVLEYISALENEIMSLRIILTGKKMGVGADTLRERLRENYV